MAISGVTGAQSIMKSGVCTSTTRPASPYDGQVIYETDTDRAMVYNNTDWVVLSTGRANPSGIDLVKTQTIGTAVSSVVVSGAFSSTYDNYKIVLSGGAGTVNNNIEMKLGSTATGYYGAFVRYNYGGSSGISTDNNATSFSRFGYMNTNGMMAVCELLGPNLAKNTFLSCGAAYASTDNGAGSYNGFLNNTTQYTDFTFFPPSGTMTGGTIYVYGYVK
jgi:hypothetical protein